MVFLFSVVLVLLLISQGVVLSASIYDSQALSFLADVASYSTGAAYTTPTGYTATPVYSTTSVSANNSEITGSTLLHPTTALRLPCELAVSASANPSAKFDQALGIATNETSMFTVGYDRGPGNNEWRIEKRSLTDGKLDGGFANGGIAKSDPGDQDDSANAIVIDSNYLYVAGYDAAPVKGFFSQWRIEKRSLKDGTFDPNFYNGGVALYDPSPWSDTANAISQSRSCLRIAGFDSTPPNQQGSDLQWRIIGAMK